MPENTALTSEIFLKENLKTDKNTCSEECPVSSAIQVIGGKWTIIILYQLRNKTHRFGELHQLIPKITKKMLTHELRKLESNGLVSRKIYAEIPPRVEYTPTELANQLNPALDLLCDWGETYQDAQEASQ